MTANGTKQLSSAFKVAGQLEFDYAITTHLVHNTSGMHSYLFHLIGVRVEAQISKRSQ